MPIETRIYPMNKGKGKRLEAKGWKIGTVSEFLKLSVEEEYQIKLKLSKSENHQLSFLNSRPTGI